MCSGFFEQECRVGGLSDGAIVNVFRAGPDSEPEGRSSCASTRAHLGLRPILSVGPERRATRSSAVLFLDLTRPRRLL